MFFFFIQDVLSNRVNKKLFHVATLSLVKSTLITKINRGRVYKVIRDLGMVIKITQANDSLLLFIGMKLF